MVGRVEESSPAASAGLQENDVILTFNAERVQNRAHFYRLLINSQPGAQSRWRSAAEAPSRD